MASARPKLVITLNLNIKVPRLVLKIAENIIII